MDYSLPDWRTELKRKAPTGAVDVVFDPIGGATFEPALRSLAMEGRYLVVGFASGSIPSLPVNLALLKNASLLGVQIRHLLGRHPPKARRVRRSLFSMVQAAYLEGTSGDHPSARSLSAGRLARHAVPRPDGKVVLAFSPT